jgi:hypothetical protein
VSAAFSSHRVHFRAISYRDKANVFLLLIVRVGC